MELNDESLKVQNIDLSDAFSLKFYLILIKAAAGFGRCGINRVSQAFLFHILGLVMNHPQTQTQLSSDYNCN